MPFLRELPGDVDLFVQRDDWPAEPVRKMGCAVNAGFIYARAANADNVVRLMQDAVVRGLIEFYLRWNNIVDQYGWVSRPSPSNPAVHPLASPLPSRLSFSRAASALARLSPRPPTRIPLVRKSYVLSESGE